MYPKDLCWKYGPGQPALFTLALTTPAMFHMIMCSSAIYMDVYSGRQESRESQLHKLEAIQCLNNGMKDKLGISDANIGAVAYLAKAEV
jgi:Fungal specific transcription factor domain